MATFKRQIKYKKNAKNVDKSCNCRESTMSPEWRYAKDSLNAFSSEHKTKKSVDKSQQVMSVPVNQQGLQNGDLQRSPSKIKDPSFI